MARRDSLRMFFHGGIILLLGSLAGFPLYAATTRAWGPDAVQFWRTAHAGVTAGGVWIIAFGTALGSLKLGPAAGSWLVWSTILSNYAVVLALLVQLATGGRLAPEVGVALIGTAVIGAGAALISVGLLIHGGWAALRAAGPS